MNDGGETVDIKDGGQTVDMKDSGETVDMKDGGELWKCLSTCHNRTTTSDSLSLWQKPKETFTVVKWAR